MSKFTIYLIFQQFVVTNCYYCYLLFYIIELRERVKPERKERDVEEGTAPFVHGIISVRFKFHVAPYFPLKKLFFYLIAR